MKSYVLKNIGITNSSKKPKLSYKQGRFDGLEEKKVIHNHFFSKKRLKSWS